SPSFWRRSAAYAHITGGSATCPRSLESRARRWKRWWDISAGYSGKPGSTDSATHIRSAGVAIHHLDDLVVHRFRSRLVPVPDGLGGAVLQVVAHQLPAYAA